MGKMRERGCARRRARPNERANERATRRGSAKVGKSRRVPSYRGSAPTGRNCLLRHGGVPRGTKCIRLVPVLVNHMERTDADGGMEETRDGVDAGVAGKAHHPSGAFLVGASPSLLAGRAVRLFALLRGLREGIARHEGEDRVVVVVDVVRVRSVGLCGRLGATSAHGERARGDDWRRRPRHGRGSGVTSATMVGEDREEVVATRRRRPGRDARARARADGERARRPDPRGRAAEKEAHVNMSGLCREDAPSGARDFQRRAPRTRLRFAS